MLHDLYKNTTAVFLAHGYVGEILGKTINGVLMHSTVFDVVALVDNMKVGIDTSQILPGVDKKVPVVSTFSESLKYKPKVLILMENTISTSLNEIELAIKSGLDIINSSFNFLSNSQRLVQLAEQHKIRLIDLRKDDYVKRNPDGSILNIKAKVVFVAGTDCGLGKRTATYELVQEARKRGIKAGFAATGQTGQMLGCDGAIMFDSIITQFAAGAVEQLIVGIDAKGFDIIFLEGQAAIMHFGTSSVLSLLHASNPHAIVLVHDQKRKFHVEYGDSPIFEMGKLNDEIEIIEKLSLPAGNQYNVVALATIGDENIHTLNAMKARGEIKNIPIGDARKAGGAAILLDAVLDHLNKEYNYLP